MIDQRSRQEETDPSATQVAVLGEFVAVSEIAVGVGRADELEAAFGERMHAVDSWPGFRRLQVWRDDITAGSYLMVSWWDTRADFVAYMRSDAHHRSHARVPGGGDDAARPVRLRKMTLVAT